MKVIIQIPCYNEAATLPGTLADLPRQIEGVDAVEWLVVDDGSTDRTSDIAREKGVDHVVRFAVNRGLATAFREGIQACLDRGADIIVNTDADNQYCGAHVERLVRPILEGRADIVIGDRGVWKHAEFGFLKKCLQRLGSWFVGHLAGIQVPDVTSGFRAFSREAATRLNILTDFTYTQETVIQAGQHSLSVVSVPVEVNPRTRPSRLFRSIPAYLRASVPTILRIYTLYRPLKVFTFLAAIPFAGGLLLGLRFLYYHFFAAQAAGKIQSLIFSAILFNLSFLLFVLGVLADLIGFNRRLLEQILLRSKSLSEEQHGQKGSGQAGA
ncbi:MAG: glycosyltransferase family 2 protein [Kiritimatiellae bacterium]|nr:glycosyltransferase family 2 protein [Kiritimatiellia bacterium]